LIVELMNEIGGEKKGMKRAGKGGGRAGEREREREATGGKRLKLRLEKTNMKRRSSHLLVCESSFEWTLR
jgi:hypothetical protein